MLRKLIRPSIVLATSMLMTSGAFAQNLAPPPVIQYGMPISLDIAKKAAGAAIAEARKNNWTMAVAIVDPGGFLVYFEKIDGTQNASADLAIEKARTAALFKRPSKLFQDAVAGGGEGTRILRLTGAIPIDGGIPIIMDGKIIGAVGVSGGAGDQDGRVSKAGADSIK